MDMLSRPASNTSQVSSRPMSNTSQMSSRPVSAISGASQMSLQSRPGSILKRAESASSQASLDSRRFLVNPSAKRDPGLYRKKSIAFGSEDNDTIVFPNGEPPRGCWYYFTKCIGGMWSTREIETNANKEVYVRTTIRELVIYVIFLVVLSFLTFSMTSTVKFYYTQIMIDLFGGYKDVQTVDNFWSFMNGDFLDSLYWEYDNGIDPSDQSEFICPDGSKSVGPCPVTPVDRNILYENKLLGLPRLRQLKVRNDSCHVSMLIQELRRNLSKANPSECYDHYSSSLEDTSNFGPGIDTNVSTWNLEGDRVTNISAWMYQTEDEIDGTPFSGNLGYYSGAGSYQDLASSKDKSSEIISELKEGLWISSGTRFISIDFTVYNANINLFCIIKIVFEFSATGGIFPIGDFRTVKLLKYVTPTDYFMLACELIFCAFVAYYTVEEVLEIRQHSFLYFGYIWNLLDIAVLVMCGILIMFNAFTTSTVETELVSLLSEPDKFADFTHLGSLTTQNGNVTAIAVFLAWVKLFKYLSFNKTMTQLTKTLSRSAKDMAGFGVMFFIAFFSFAIFGYALFCPDLPDYQSFGECIFTLLRIILGEFDFPGMMASQPILAPWYFFAYVVFIFFILLNMFLAIINDTYAEVKDELASKQADQMVEDYFKKGYTNVIGKLSGQDSSKPQDIMNALRAAYADDEIVTYAEIRQNLKKCNFSDMEIEMFISQYDNDENDEIDENEAVKVFRDLTDGKQITGVQEGFELPYEKRLPPPSDEDLANMIIMVDELEEKIGEMVGKLDAAVDKMTNVEKSKALKKESMNKILAALFSANDDGLNDEERKSKVEEMVKSELQKLDSNRQ